MRLFNEIFQAEEKRAYFKNLGAEISAERSQNGIEEDLQKIIGVCDKCFTDTENAGKIEEVLNGIVSMLATVSFFWSLSKLVHDSNDRQSYLASVILRSRPFCVDFVRLRDASHVDFFTVVYLVPFRQFRKFQCFRCLFS